MSLIENMMFEQRSLKESKKRVKKTVKEDTVRKSNGKWTNRGDTGKEHGTFKTKKQADAQRKAMYANGYKGESLKESYDDVRTLDYTRLVDLPDGSQVRVMLLSVNGSLEIEVDNEDISNDTYDDIVAFFNGRGIDWYPYSETKGIEELKYAEELLNDYAHEGLSESLKEDIFDDFSEQQFVTRSFYEDGVNALKEAINNFVKYTKRTKDSYTVEVVKKLKKILSDVQIGEFESVKKKKPVKISEGKINKYADERIRAYYNHEIDLPELHDELLDIFSSIEDAVKYLRDNDSRIKNESVNLKESNSNAYISKRVSSAADELLDILGEYSSMFSPDGMNILNDEELAEIGEVADTLYFVSDFLKDNKKEESLKEDYSEDDTFRPDYDWEMDATRFDDIDSPYYNGDLEDSDFDDDYPEDYYGDEEEIYNDVYAGNANGIRTDDFEEDSFDIDDSSYEIASRIVKGDLGENLNK